MRAIGLMTPRRLGVSLLVVALALVAPGGDTTASMDLLMNGTFDTGVSGWALVSGSALNTLRFVPNEDSKGSLYSGVAEVRIGEGPLPPGQGYTEAAVQCVPVVAGQPYLGRALVRFPDLNQYQGTQAGVSLFWYPDPACAGGFISSTLHDWLRVSDSWRIVRSEGIAPPNAQGARIRLEVDGQDPDGPHQSYAYFDDVMLLMNQRGDADCDKRVNAIDAALILQHDAGLVGLLTCIDRADVNGSNSVNSLDAALVLQYVAGLIPSLPPLLQY